MRGRAADCEIEYSDNGGGQAASRPKSCDEFLAPVRRINFTVIMNFLRHCRLKCHIVPTAESLMILKRLVFLSLLIRGTVLTVGVKM